MSLHCICIVFRTSLPASDSLSLHCLFVLFSEPVSSLRFPQFALFICIVFRTSLQATHSLSLHCLFVLFSVSQPQIPSVYTVYLYCFQNQSSSHTFPQFTLSICIVFRTSLPASDSLSLHCLFVLFSEPVSQPQIPSVYTVYLYGFHNQSPSHTFPRFTLSICIVFRTSLPASDFLSLHCVFVLFSEPVSQPEIPSVCTVCCFQSPSLSASDSLSLHCVFVLFSEPVSQPLIPSVYTVYLYCFHSPSLRFPQFTLYICIVFRTSLPATHSLSLHCLFVLFSEPVSQPQIPSIYTVYWYCFQNQSPSHTFPHFTLSICIVFSLPASDSLSLHCIFVLFSEPASQPHIPSVYTVYLYCFQNQFQPQIPQFTLSICIVFRTSLPASDSLSLHCLFVLFSEPVFQPQIPQFTLYICIVFRTSLPASDSLSLHCLFVLLSQPVSQPHIPSVYTVYLYCFQNQSPSHTFLSLHCLFVLFSEPVSQPPIPSVCTVYLYCFQNQSPSLKFPQFALSICVVFILPAYQPQIPSVCTVYLYCFQNQSPSL